jgi:outer membrane protein OmpA-like peptidoglycan-associated protein
MNKYSSISIIIAGLLFASVFGTLAQNSQSADNTWKTGWHIDAGGGVQTLFSSDVTNLSFKQRFTPYVSLGVGKWISPFWGVRLQAGGYGLNGYSTTEGTYLSDPLGNGAYGVNDPVREQVAVRHDGSYRHYLRYVNVHLAAELSLLNLLNRDRKDSRWDIIPALGVGYLRSLGYKGTPVTDNVTANLSLRGKFEINTHWDVYLEATAAAVDGKFDGRITRQECEAYSGLTLGISYRFPQPKRKPRPAPSQPVSPPLTENAKVALSIGKVEERLSAIEKKLDDKDAAPAKTVERVIVEKPQEKSPEKPFVLASILFGLNQKRPAKGQDIDLANVARYLNEHPKAKIRLEGYGDKGTGTPEQNLKVSIKRADYVRRTLIETFGVASGRIETQAVGSNVQPYEKNDWNRLVLIVCIPE